MFDDLLEANERYAQTFAYGELKAPAARRFALVTCIDSRIDPLTMLGLAPGDAKFLRNAGGRVTDDVERSLAAATAVLGVTRVAVVEHTLCKMSEVTQDDVVSAVGDAAGIDAAQAGSVDYRTIADQEAAVRADVERLRGCPLLRKGTVVGGFILELADGRLRQIV